MGLWNKFLCFFTVLTMISEEHTYARNTSIHMQEILPICMYVYQLGSPLRLILMLVMTPKYNSFRSSNLEQILYVCDMAVLVIATAAATINH